MASRLLLRGRSLIMLKRPEVREVVPEILNVGKFTVNITVKKFLHKCQPRVSGQ